MSDAGDFGALNGTARGYATTAAFEAALKARLAAQVTPSRTIQSLRKLLAFDRVLARLSHVAPDAWLLKGLAAQGFTSLTPIQAQTFPHAIKGRDIIGVAQTVRFFFSTHIYAHIPT